MKEDIKSTISVMDMGHMLGLKKTDSYWLVNKHFFETVRINGKLRVVLSSFNEWYDNQDKYRKKDGPPPGKVLKSSSYSVNDVCHLIGVSSDTVYTLINQGKIGTEVKNGKTRISKAEFERWYQSQSKFRTEEDRLRDRKAEESSITMPEMARILGVHRNTVYDILQKHGDSFEFLEIAGRKRITKESFERWYAGQTRYVKTSDRRPRISQEKTAAKCVPDKSLYSPEEAAVVLGISLSKVYRMIHSGEIEVKKFGNSIRISREEITWQKFLLSGDDESEKSGR